MLGFNEIKKEEHKEEVDRPKAVVKTNKGSFTIELYAKECPETVWNFINLAEGRQKCKKEGPYYNGLIFHRIIEGFMIQGGCPDGTGMGGPGYRFEDECTPELVHDSEGILSMANAGPGTNGSQFFITLGATPHLNGRHTVFGKVTDGLDIIRAIGVVETGAMDRPVDEVVMETVTIER